MKICSESKLNILYSLFSNILFLYSSLFENVSAKVERFLHDKIKRYLYIPLSPNLFMWLLRLSFNTRAIIMILVITFVIYNTFRESTVRISRDPFSKAQKRKILNYITIIISFKDAISVRVFLIRSSYTSSLPNESLPRAESVEAFYQN